MEFILQLLADLLVPDEKNETNHREEVSTDVKPESEAAMVAPIIEDEKLIEGENIFGLMEFH